MPSPEAVYPLVVRWIEAMLGPAHPLAQRALAQVVTAVLLSQRLTATGVMRTMLSDLTVPARQRYKRVARALRRPWLAPAFLTPRLVRAALALASPASPHLALDSVRLGRWEVFTVGLVWHTRVLVVGWAVLPYPWPKRRFTPTVCALLAQVAAAWPAEAPPPHLVADRGFPSKRFFATLQRLGWDFTIRLRATDAVVVHGVPQTVRALIAQAVVGTWSAMEATYGGGRHAAGATLVLGRGLAVVPAHQRDDGSARARTHQQARRAHHVASKRGPGVGRLAPDTDRWMVRFTTQSQVLPALRSYRQRWATEGSYRDAQSGWDGRCGWDLHHAASRLGDADTVARLSGLWALCTLLQSWLGDGLARSRDPAVRAFLAGCSTTGRLSVWARAHLALSDRSGRLTPWLLDRLHQGTHVLAATPPLPATTLPFAPRPLPPLPQVA
jgi:hypothetical protein